MSTFVVCSLRFEGFHCWPTAPDEVAFLRHRHRHEFHVRLVKRVTHSDRDIEFILLKREAAAWVEQQKERREATTWSCEQWAQALSDRFSLSECEVSEDGENGALVRA